MKIQIKTNILLILISSKSSQETAQFKFYVHIFILSILKYLFNPLYIFTKNKSELIGYFHIIFHKSDY